MKKFIIWLRSLSDPDYVWEHGTCNNLPARRNKLHGNVQFVLWKAGEQGHQKDFWINFDRSWWVEFKPTP